MNDASKVKPSHIQRAAFIYIRQSSPAQVEYNRESTARQYALVDKACQLGWAKEQVIVIDEDLGVSGSGFAERSGFARLTAEVALGHVGIVFGLEVSRVARNNADWYRLFDLCSITDTLVGDSDGLYHPALFNDRLVLGLKGIMAEAELHILRARLEGGIRNKAARGELRRLARGLRVGRTRRRSSFSSRRIRGPHHACRLCEIHGIRIGSQSLAVVPLRGSFLPHAEASEERDSVGGPDLHRHPCRTHQSGVCWRVHLRKISSRTVRR